VSHSCRRDGEELPRTSPMNYLAHYSSLVPSRRGWAPTAIPRRPPSDQPHRPPARSRPWYLSRRRSSRRSAGITAHRSLEQPPSEASTPRSEPPVIATPHPNDQPDLLTAFRRPIMSPILPPVTINIAMTRELDGDDGLDHLDLVSSRPQLADRPRSSRAWSSTIRNWAPKITSGPQHSSTGASPRSLRRAVLSHWSPRDGSRPPPTTDFT